MDRREYTALINDVERQAKEFYRPLQKRAIEIVQVKYKQKWPFYLLKHGRVDADVLYDDHELLKAWRQNGIDHSAVVAATERLEGKKRVLTAPLAENAQKQLMKGLSFEIQCFATEQALRAVYETALAALEVYAQFDVRFAAYDSNLNPIDLENA